MRDYDWYPARTRLMFARAIASAGMEGRGKDTAKRITARLLRSCAKSIEDTCKIHATTLEKELERVKEERDRWMAEALEYQKKLNDCMIAETARINSERISDNH